MHFCIPERIVAFICNLFSNPNNQYTDHRDVDDKGNKIDGSNEFFESVLPDSVQGVINYGAAKKHKKIAMLDNAQFHIDQVRAFFSCLPIEGWQVT